MAIGNMEMEMIDVERIESLVAECPVKTFEADANGIVCNDLLGEYIDKCAVDLIHDLPSNLTSVLESHFEAATAAADVTERISLSSFFLNVCAGIFNYAQAVVTRWSDAMKCVGMLMKTILDCFHAYFSLLLVGRDQVAVAQGRMMYESYVYLRLIGEYPDLGRPYLEHAAVNRHRIENALESGSTTDSELAHVQQLLKKYGKAFRFDHGWMGSRIEKKDQGITAVAKMLGLEGYRSFYQIACNVVHVSSFSLQWRDAKDMDALYDAITATGIELMTNAVMKCIEVFGVPKEVKVLLMNVLYALREGLYGEPTAAELFRR